jgi:hypothetical protein
MVAPAVAPGLEAAWFGIETERIQPAGHFEPRLVTKRDLGSLA